jgi:hypothetical protein
MRAIFEMLFGGASILAFERFARSIGSQSLRLPSGTTLINPLPIRVQKARDIQ